MAFQTIGFIGLGLIGGSIAKKMKSNQPDIKIYATAHHKETIEEAYREGLIENNDLLPLSAFSDCDYIFLCAPVQRNLAYLRQLKDIIRSDCYITDVGSTKTEIHEEVIRLGMEANFIGGHPITFLFYTSPRPRDTPKIRMPPFSLKKKKYRQPTTT